MFSECREIQRGLTMKKLTVNSETRVMAERFRGRGGIGFEQYR